MSVNDDTKKSLLTHVTRILFRPKPQEQAAPAAPALTPEEEARKKAEAEEKRARMLDAYAKHCEEAKLHESAQPQVVKDLKFR